MSKPWSQGRMIISHLKHKPHTYLDMLCLYEGCSPWKRVAECLQPDEVLIKGKNRDGLTTWRVRRVARVG